MWVEGIYVSKSVLEVSENIEIPDEVIVRDRGMIGSHGGGLL